MPKPSSHPAPSPPAPVRSTGQVAVTMNVTRRTVEKWCEQGLVRHFRTPGGQYRIEVDEHEHPLDGRDE